MSLAPYGGSGKPGTGKTKDKGIEPVAQSDALPAVAAAPGAPMPPASEVPHTTFDLVLGPTAQMNLQTFPYLPALPIPPFLPRDPEPEEAPPASGALSGPALRTPLPATAVPGQ
jgi:hypothetical protein